MMWKEYLNRIGLDKSKISIDEVFLKEVHRQHVLTIPFEDLDIQANAPISLNLDSIFNKVVGNNRGGFCYELNYLFCSLLRAIGFDSHIVSSRIYSDDGILGPEFDHMSIVVTLNNSKWLLDVGYGDLFIQPLKLEDQFIGEDWFKFYRIDSIEEENFLLSESKDGKSFTKRYQFSAEPRKIEDFEQQCQLKQNSTGSYFVKNLICTLPNQTGRSTVFNNKLIEKTNGVRKEVEIKGAIELMAVLRNNFNIEIQNNRLLNYF